MVPTVSAGGAAIPALGLGTWQLRGETAIRAVHAALDAGYRHIDTASLYDNEREIGEALATHPLGADRVFVTTKVWPSDVGAGRLQRSAEASLRRLRLDRVDLLLIHWPSRDVSLEEQVGALVDAKRQGLARHIGVGNFPAGMLDEAVRIADEPIVTNQVEHHPYLDQSSLAAVCRRHDVAMTSYSPLGKGTLLSDPVLTEIAREKGRTPAQIVLRWHIQQPGNCAIPRSSKPHRIAENIDIIDFDLDQAEMARIGGLARSGGRILDGSFAPDWGA